jgi:hypothetical protein
MVAVVKSLLKRLLYGLYLVVVVIAGLELCYRFQLLDFYHAELTGLNAEDQLHSTKEFNLLICGDSFSGDANNYGNHLRQALKSFNVINTSVSGTSVIEASVILPSRIKTYQPDILIYQVYVGNDLVGIRHKINWNGSFFRNVYYWLGDRVYVLRYLNYKAGQMKFLLTKDKVDHFDPTASDTFSIARYRPRERMYASEDPLMISDAVLLENGRLDDLARLVDRFEKMILEMNSRALVYVLVIPHKAQMNATYQAQMTEVGFKFSGKFNAADSSYPFLAELIGRTMRLKNVKVLNPLGALRSKDTVSSPMYYANDEHLTPLGQKVVADFILSEIRLPLPTE